MRLLEETEDKQVDIINMSLGFSGMSVGEAEGFPFAVALKMCSEFGRDGKGICLIASAGNDNGEIINIPAALPYVFSVAATNPADQIKSAGDGFDPDEINWGSSYFNYLDVAAPGICITSTDFSDDTDLTGFPEDIGTGYAEGDYHSFSGTSAAAPIVSGIAALVLEKAPDLTNNELYDVIRFSCEKVGVDPYSNPTASGRTLKLGYGRVNACQALNIVEELGVSEHELNFSILNSNPVIDVLKVSVEGLANYKVSLIDLNGKVLFESEYENTDYFDIDMQMFAAGIYYLSITDMKTYAISTKKVIKN